MSASQKQECYYALTDDYYNSVYCDLPEGHEGPHRASFEWETRPYDICAASSHLWSEWQPYITNESAIHWESLWRKAPTKQRQCSRCGRVETDGIGPTIYPTLTPVRNRLPK